MSLLNQLSTSALSRLVHQLQRAVSATLNYSLSTPDAQALLASATGHATWDHLTQGSQKHTAALDATALSDATLRQMVKGLRKGFATHRFHEVAQYQAQDILAQTLGYPHWFALSKRSAPAAVAFTPMPGIGTYGSDGEYSSQHKAAVAYLFRLYHADERTGPFPMAATPSPRVAKAFQEVFDLAAQAGADGISLYPLQSGHESTSSGDLQLHLWKKGFEHSDIDADQLSEYGMGEDWLAPGVDPKQFADQLAAWELTYWDLAIKDPQRLIPAMKGKIALADRDYWMGVLGGVKPALTLLTAPGKRRRPRR